MDIANPFFILYGSFNRTNVVLKGDPEIESCPMMYCFNRTNVVLKELLESQGVEKNRGFNRTNVVLKVFFGRRKRRDGEEFQSN